jgi:vanillate O-demethylase ferredoxin subunit
MNHSQNCSGVNLFRTARRMNKHSLQIRQIRLEAHDIASFELATLDGSALPPAPPGGHVDIQIPDGPRRSYSLLGPDRAADHYRIAVKREHDSRGGSLWLHERSRVGQVLQVSDPHDDFPLIESAPHTVLVAGGIGVTALLPMAQRLTALRRPWTLHYATRDVQSTAFDAELQRLEQETDRSVLRYRTRAGDARMDMGAVVRAAPPGSHFYCCGPAPMLDAYLAATRDLAPDRVHMERFASSQQAAVAGGYTLVLARSDRRLAVVPGRSMLGTLLDAGVDVPHACTQGICGTCRLDVLAGEPDHRDECLTEAERDGKRCVIACCSGARTPALTLDL